MAEWVSGDWVTGNFNAVKLPWFTNESASETDSHDEDDFDEDDRDRHVTKPSGAPQTKEESEKSKDLNPNETVKGYVFKQRANSDKVKSYAADKVQQDKKLADTSDNSPQANAEQVKRADTALKEAEAALKAAKQSLAKAELALKDTKAEFMKRKNDREKHLSKQAAKQQKDGHGHKDGPKHDDNPFGGFVMDIYAKSAAKFTVLVVGRAPHAFQLTACAWTRHCEPARAGRTRSWEPS